MLTASYDDNHPEEGFIPDWVRALAGKVDRLSLIITRPPASIDYPKNLSFYYLKSKTKLGRLVELWQKLNLIDQTQSVDGAFTHIFSFLGIVAGLWAKLKRIKSAMWFAGGTRIKWFGLDWWALKLNDVVLTCSLTEKNRYQRFLGKKKTIRVIGHGINPDRFHPKKNEFSRKKTLVIGYAARLRPIKNFELLIRAASLLPTTLKYELHLCISAISGHEGYLNQLKKLAQLLKVPLILHKELSYVLMPAFYQSLDLYVHPSKMTSIDKSALEAVFCEVPVLLSYVGFKPVISNQSILGFDPDSSMDLKHKILSVEKQRREYISSFVGLIEKVNCDYTLDVLMQKLIREFK